EVIWIPCMTSSPCFENGIIFPSLFFVCWRRNLNNDKRIWKVLSKKRERNMQEMATRSRNYWYNPLLRCSRRIAGIRRLYIIRKFSGTRGLKPEDRSLTLPLKRQTAETGSQDPPLYILEEGTTIYHAEEERQ